MRRFAMGPVWLWPLGVVAVMWVLLPKGAEAWSEEGITGAKGAEAQIEEDITGEGSYTFVLFVVALCMLSLACAFLIGYLIGRLHTKEAPMARETFPEPPAKTKTNDTNQMRQRLQSPPGRVFLCRYGEVFHVAEACPVLQKYRYSTKRSCSECEKLA